MRAIILSILFTVLCVTAISAETIDHYYELGARGYELVLDMRYDEADKIFDEMIRMEPKNAAGYIYKSQSFFHRWRYTMIEPDKKALAQFKALLFKSANIAEKMPDRDNAVTLFILGSAYGNMGFYYANTKNWFRAWWYGRKGIKYIKKAIKKDPEYYNSYFPLGIYNYYRATLPKVIKPLSFLLGGEEEGKEKAVEQLRLASSKSDLKGDARIFLADSVYYQEGNFKKASALLEELKSEYPDNFYISLALAVSYRHLNQYDLSVQTIRSSLRSESIKKFPGLHGDLYYNLGMAYSGMNEYAKAIMAYKYACKISKKIKGAIPDHYDVLALYGIGNAYEMVGSIDKAREYYSGIKAKDNRSAYESAQARIKNPLTPAQISLIKGRNFLKYAKYSKAETIFKGLVNPEINKEPVDNTFKAEACLYLGEAQYHLEEYQNSIRTLIKVFTFRDVRKKWINPWSHYWLASCYREIGDTERAKQEYDIAYGYDDIELRSEIDEARNKM